MQVAQNDHAARAKYRRRIEASLAAVRGFEATVLAVGSFAQYACLGPGGMLRHAAVSYPWPRYRQSIEAVWRLNARHMLMAGGYDGDLDSVNKQRTDWLSVVTSAYLSVAMPTGVRLLKDDTTVHTHLLLIAQVVIVHGPRPTKRIRPAISMVRKNRQIFPTEINTWAAQPLHAWAACARHLSRSWPVPCVNPACWILWLFCVDVSIDASPCTCFSACCLSTHRVAACSWSVQHVCVPHV